MGRLISPGENPMAVYFVTGKLGSGKTLGCVSKIKDYLSDGRRVATNLDLHLDEMFTYCKSTVVRLPDKPRSQDMVELGQGYEPPDSRHYDESKFGLIVLDECGTWLNSREWNDKDRRKLIDWFLHARKHRWDVMFLIQDIESCDGQILRSLCEHLVVCRRMDRFKLLGFSLPRVHIANVYYGQGTQNYVERWVYRGGDLYGSYDTVQRFSDGVEYFESGPVDMRAPYTMLSAWHLKGRYLPPLASDVPILRCFNLFFAGLLLKPFLFVWCILDPQNFYRTAFRKKWQAEYIENGRQKLQERRHQLLAAALDPNTYPPHESP